MKSPPISGRRCADQHRALQSFTASRSPNVDESRSSADDAGELTATELSSGQQLLGSLLHGSRNRHGDDGVDWSDSCRREVEIFLDTDNVYRNDCVMKNGNNELIRLHCDETLRKIDMTAKGERQHVDKADCNDCQPPMLVNPIGVSFDGFMAKVDYLNDLSLAGCSSSVRSDDDTPCNADDDSDNMVSFSTQFWTPIQSSHSSFAD